MTDLKSEYVVTYSSGVIHRRGCPSLRNNNARVMSWVGGERLNTDRPCSRCIGWRWDEDPRKST